jgi:hypothetical protein
LSKTAAENRLQLVLLLGVGGMAGAASFRHVHDLAASHGQPGWFAWSVAISIEAMALAAGLEIRRSRRVGKPVGVPVAALVGGVALSLSAQLAQAEPSPWGWILAAVPAMAFLTVLKFTLRRLDHLASEPQTASIGVARPVLFTTDDPVPVGNPQTALTSPDEEASPISEPAQRPQERPVLTPDPQPARATSSPGRTRAEELTAALLAAAHPA